MAAQIVWLDGGGEQGADPGEVGDRAAALDRLCAGGLAVPRSFVLGRSMFLQFATAARREAAVHVPVKLATELYREIGQALRSLGGSYAIRRSPLDGGHGGGREDPHWLTTTQGGRPERETYLHLTDVAEVSEAIRRIWGAGVTASHGPSPVAIMVQRFMAPEVCAAMRRDRHDPEVVHILSSLGTGDLLAAGLVVPDKHSVRRADGSVIKCSLGRKAQMTVPRPDGGLVRVPVPAQAARQLAVDDAKLRELHDTWRSAEEALPSLSGLGVCWSGGRWYVTSAVSARAIVQEEALLG